MRMRTVPGLIAALLCSCLPAVATAQTVGAIRGTVLDATGAVVPGVPVVLSNPGTIGGNQQAVTDQRGAYQFTQLVPSNTYGVQAELAGFRAAARSNISVNAGVTVRVDLTLEAGEVSETVTVSGQAPLLDTTTVARQMVMDRATLDALPTSNDIWSIGRMMPALISARVDVGGSESLQQSSNSIHGAGYNENTYLFDGLDTSNPLGGGTTATYFDVAMFDEVNFVTGTSDAEHEKGGLIYNLVSKTGTNQFRGWYIGSATDRRLNFNNVSPELRRDLLAAVPARVLQVNPDFTPRVQLLTFYDMSFGMAGPVVRDKLWFTGSGQLKALDRYRVGQYDADGTQGLDDNRQRNYSFKFSWQASPRNQIHFIRQWNQRLSLHRILGPVAFYESRAMFVQDLRDPIDQVKWTSTLSRQLLLDVAASRFHPYVPSSAQPEVQPGDLPRFDLVTQTHMVAQGVYDSLAEYPKRYVHASLNYFLGAHDLKMGYQFQRGWSRTEHFSTSHYPSGLRALVRSGVPDSVNTYSTPTVVKNYIQDHGLYLQDKWQPTRRLTLNLGLRMQKTNGWVPAVCQEQTIFIQARCFDRIDGVPDFLDVAPRFALVYDLAGNGKTALKVSVNRYNYVVGATHAGRINPMRATNDTRSWNDRNRDSIPQLDELGPSTGFNLGTTSRYSADLERPYVNTVTAGLERQIFGDSVLALTFIHRQTRRQIGSKNLLVPLESYTPITVTERTSGQQVTVYDQHPALRGQFDILFDNFSELDANFNGFDVTFNKRLANRWMIISGLSYGRNIGDIYDTGDLNNPNLTFRRGVIGFDVPWSFKASGVYELPHAIRLSATVQHVTGFPELDSVNVGRDTVVLTQVTQAVAIAPRATNRLPDINMVDVSLKKVFNIGDRRTIQPAIEGFNLLNASTVQSRITTLGAAYHQATQIVQGRMLRFGLNVQF